MSHCRDRPENIQARQPRMLVDSETKLRYITTSRMVIYRVNGTYKLKYKYVHILCNKNQQNVHFYINVLFFFIVAPCILITLMFLSPTNALLYYTYKMLKYTVKISHDCSYMFRSVWTIIREPMPNLAKVTILCRCSVKIRR